MKPKNLFKVAVGRSHRKLSANKRIQLFRLASTGLPGPQLERNRRKRRVRSHTGRQRFSSPPPRKSIRHRLRAFIAPKRKQAQGVPPELVNMSEVLLRTAEGIRQNELHYTAPTWDQASGSDMDTRIAGPSEVKISDSRTNLGLYPSEENVLDPCDDSTDAPMDSSSEGRNDSAGAIGMSLKPMPVASVHKPQLDDEPSLLDLDAASERHTSQAKAHERGQDDDSHGENLQESGSDMSYPGSHAGDRPRFGDGHIPLIYYATNAPNFNQTRVQRKRQRGQRLYKLRKRFARLLHWLGLGDIRVPTPPPSHDSLVVDRHPQPSGIPSPYTLSRDGTERHTPLNATRSLLDVRADEGRHAADGQQHRTDWIPPVSNSTTRRRRSGGATGTPSPATPLLPIREEHRHGLSNRSVRRGSSSPRRRRTSSGRRTASSPRIYQLSTPAYPMHVRGVHRLDSISTIFRQMLHLPFSGARGNSSESLGTGLGHLPFEREDRDSPSADEPDNIFAHTIKGHIARMNRDLRDFQCKIQAIEQGFVDLYAAFAEIEEVSHGTVPPPSDLIATEDMIEEAEEWINSVIATRNSLFLKSDITARLWTACKKNMQACRIRSEQAEADAVAANFMRMEEAELARIRQTIAGMPVVPKAPQTSTPVSLRVEYHDENPDENRQPYLESQSPSPEDLPRPSSGHRTWIRFFAQRSHTPEMLKSVSKRLGKLKGGSADTTPSPPESSGNGNGNGTGAAAGKSKDKGKGKQRADDLPARTPPPLSSHPAFAGQEDVEDDILLGSKYARMLMQLGQRSPS